MEKRQVSIIIPAYNEHERLKHTLETLREWEKSHSFVSEIIVVDDGSTDQTGVFAERLADTCIQHPRNKGKGQALQSGWDHVSSQSDIIVFLDADLEESAQHVSKLIQPIASGVSDLTIAKLPPAQKKAGFGAVRKLASWGIVRLTGFQTEEPLSGQRAMKRDLLETIGTLQSGFGIEVGLTIEARRRGFRVSEIEVPFRHRETGRDISGFLHRFKQLLAVGQTLWGLWRRPT